MKDDTQTLTFDIVLGSESRAAGGSNRITAKAAVFSSRSEDMGFRETLRAGAFAGALKAPGDIHLYWQHDHTRPLASRAAGNLTIAEDGEGLAVTATLPNTATGQEAKELIRTGIVKKMSFAMSGITDRWYRGPDGEDAREILSVKYLPEVSIVTRPAYEATSVDLERGARELAEVRARAGRISIRDRNPYSPGSTHSWFRDRALVDLAEQRKVDSISAAIESGGPPRMGQGWDTPFPAANADSDPEKAASRLREMRSALNTAAGEGGAFAPQGMPPQLMEAFVTAARAQSVLPDVLGFEPMPKGTGTKLRIPAFLTGATTSVQATEGAAVSNTTPTTGYLESSPALISGFVNATQQLLDLTGPVDLDMFLAAELGRALGKELDTQLLAGSGAEQQTTGILKATGTTATTWTAASPTAQKLVTEGIGKCWAEVFTALGRVPDVILWSPRRHAWVFTQKDTSTLRVVSPHVLDALAPPTQVPAMPTTLNSTQDPVIILNRESVKLYLDPPRIRAMVNPLSGTLEVRYLATQWCGLIVREPKGVGILTGSGLTTPTFA